MNENPYESPTIASSAAAPMSDAEAMRKQYLNHEASVKSIGTLYFLGAIFMVPLSLIMFVSGIGAMAAVNADVAQGVVLAGIGVLYLVFGLVQGATAIGLRKLQTWARYVAVLFSVIGLIGIPIGTLISGYFLYLLLSKKGSVVFSEEYKHVIAATPHIKYKTSIIVVIFLVLLAVLLVGGLLAFLLGGTP